METIFLVIGIIPMLTMLFDRTSPVMPVMRPQPQQRPEKRAMHLWLINSDSVKPCRAGRHPMSPQWYVPAV